MQTAAEYRAMAEECFKWAREAQDDEVRVPLQHCFKTRPPTPDSDTIRARRRVEGEMKTIRQSKVIRTCKGACRVGDIVIFDVLGGSTSRLRCDGSGRS